MIVSKCNVLADAGIIKPFFWGNLRLNDMFYRQTYIQSGEILGLVGAYYGIVLDAIFLGGTSQKINITGHRGKCLARFGFVLLCWFLPVTLMGYISREAFVEANSYGLEYLVRNAIPYFICSLFLFSFAKSAMSKLKIVNVKQSSN